MFCESLLNVMFEFFRSHISDICFLISFVILVINNIVQLVQKSRSEKLSEILVQIPEIIAQIESLFPCGNGDIKLGYVLRQIESKCKSYGLKFDKQYFLEIVEKVLSAPSKNK